MSNETVDSSVTLSYYMKPYPSVVRTCTTTFTKTVESYLSGSSIIYSKYTCSKPKRNDKLCLSLVITCLNSIRLFRRVFSDISIN